MAIIYTYPTVSNVQSTDLLLISDSSDGNKTRSVSLKDIKKFVSGGSAAFLTVKTQDGGTSVGDVVEMKVSDGTLTDNGSGVVTVQTKTPPAGATSNIQFALTGPGGLDFAGSSKFTVDSSSSKMSIQSNLDVVGDGALNKGTLTLSGEGNIPNSVSIKGPAAGVAYGVTLPSLIAPQTKYTTGGRILEIDGSGDGIWIDTPIGGTNVVANPSGGIGSDPALTYIEVGATRYKIAVQETSGTWIPVLGTSVGNGESLRGRGVANFNTGEQKGTWRRIDNMIYYDFYIGFTLLGANPSTATLLTLGQDSVVNGQDVLPLPVDSTALTTSPYPTIGANTLNNGSCQITEQDIPDSLQEVFWQYMPVSGKVGRDAAGVVSLCAHPHFNTATNSAQRSRFTLPWFQTTELVNCKLAGTIIAQVKQPV